MMNDSLVGKIIQQKLLAEAKYPNFAKTFMQSAADPSFQLKCIKGDLAEARRVSDAEKPNYSVQATLAEEVIEVFEAGAEERWEDCMMELAQVGSVVLRAMEWVQNNKLNKEINNV